MRRQWILASPPFSLHTATIPTKPVKRILEHKLDQILQGQLVLPAGGTVVFQYFYSSYVWRVPSQIWNKTQLIKYRCLTCLFKRIWILTINHKQLVTWNYYCVNAVTEARKHPDLPSTYPLPPTENTALSQLLLPPCFSARAQPQQWANSEDSNPSFIIH